MLKYAILAFLTFLVSIFVFDYPSAALADGVSSVDTVKVSCECKTKANPSACKLKMSDWQVIKYSREAATNDEIVWDQSFIRSYCFRHKVDACQCEDESLFSGAVE